MRRPSRLLTAAGVAALALTTFVTSDVAQHASAAAADPWTDANYTPSPGDWHPYVLAPSDRDVAPVSASAAARGGSVTGDPAGLVHGDGSVQLTSTGGPATSPLVTLDFGKEVGGRVQVHVTSASDQRPALHVCFSESKRYAALQPQDNDGEAAYAPGCDTANIWNGYPGTKYTYDSDSHDLKLGDTSLPATLTDTQPRGFRYATLFLDGAGSVTVDKVSLHFDAAPKQQDPSDYAGWFLSSDNELNKIWYAGAYTVQTNTWLSDTAKSWPYTAGEADHADAQVPHADPNQEVIFDGAKRDRIVWQGDLAVQAPVTYLSTDDVGAVDNSLSSLAAQQLPDGYVPAESLVGQHNQDEIRTYGEYVTWFVNNMYEHWLYTGDRAYLDTWWPALTKATAWLEAQRALDPQGLIAFAASGSCGHYGYSDCGHETYVNALYMRNLQQMSALATARSDTGAAATYRHTATTLRTAIRSQLWDDKVGAFRLSREIPDAYPQDANAAAVLTGVATAQQATRAMDYLRRTSWAKYGALTVAPSTSNSAVKPFYEPLPSGFEAGARLSLTDPSGLAQESGLDLMRTFWGYQLTQDPQSTFAEKLDLDGQPGLKQFTSLAHGWAAAPTTILSTQVLGVAPTSAGFADYAVTPHPGDLTWAQGRVPTPHGAISASWRTAGSGTTLTVDAPAGTTGRLAVPTGGADVRVTLDGTTVWDGSAAVGGSGATSGGGYVTVPGVAAGAHVLKAVAQQPVATAAQVVVTPDQQSVAPGGLVHLTATVTGRAARRFTGTLQARAPKTWTVQPGDTRIARTSNGRPVSVTTDLYVQVSPDAKAGASIPVTFRSDDGVTATAKARLTLTGGTGDLLYDFEDGTDGWTAGANVDSVAKVASMANGPGTCYHGSGCLEATSASAPVSALRTVQVSPAAPLDLSKAKALTLAVDGYGGAPGASGYEAVVTLTGAGGETLETTKTISTDSWNPLSIDISAWAPRSSVSKIEVAFHGVGSDTAWLPRFQLDAVGTTG